MIIDFALQKYPFIIATVVSIIVFFILKRFTDSLVARIGTKAEFPKARTQLVKKYIDVLLGALLFLVLVSIWGVKPDQILLHLLYTYASRGGVFCPMVYTEQCYRRGDSFLLFPF